MLGRNRTRFRQFGDAPRPIPARPPGRQESLVFIGGRWQGASGETVLGGKAERSRVVLALTEVSEQGPQRHGVSVFVL